MMNTHKILAVAPYEGMRELMLSAAQQLEDIQLTVCVGDLEAGVELARKELERESYDILISRGGTAELLLQQFDIPVLSISISVFDILQAIKLAENYEGKFAVVGFPSITHYVGLLCELMHYDLDVFTVHEGAEVAGQLRELKEKNYSMVLCDMVASTEARRIGMNAILITSGIESIQSVLQQACRLCASISQQKRTHAITHQALLLSPVHTVVLDNRTGGILLNSAPEEPASPANKLLTQLAQSLVPGEESRAQRSVDNDLYDIHARVELCQDETLTFGYVQKKAGAALKGIQSFSPSELSGELFSSYYGSSHCVGNVRESIERYSATSLPILLIGERGTGKDSAAAYLYEHSSYSNQPFYLIDCGGMSERQWHAFVEKPDSPFNKVGCTLFFKGIDQLNKQFYPSFYALFENAAMQQRNRMIFSCYTSEGEMREILQFVLALPNCLSLLLPPLRERREDLQSLATLYLNQLNSLLGRQIIGFGPEAFAAMQQYDWPQNIDQFKRVLRQLVVDTEGFYVSRESVQKCLAQEKRLYAPPAPGAPGNIDLTKTLGEITYDVISAVLAEEKGNKKNTAQRLGISRSTVWRVLNEK